MLFIAGTAGAAAADDRIRGVWAANGYGRLLDVRSESVDTYGVTATSCVWHEGRTLNEFLARIERIDLTQAGRFSYYDEGGITRYDFTRLDALPERCRDARAAAPDPDAVVNFEVFWRSVAENYAFFETRQVDWNEAYERYRPRVTAQTTPAELYGILAELIELLDDPHVTLSGEGLDRHYSSRPGTLKSLLQQELPAGETATREQFAAAAKAVIADEYLRDSRRSAADGQFTWGWAADDIGYLSIDSMYGYLGRDDATLRDTLRLVDKIMLRVTDDLRGARGIIVDARWNGGGEDSNALQIAAYFTDQALLALTKRARDGDTLTPVQRVYIPAHVAEPYAGPVVYLCARDTLSAAEIFSMAMMAMPNVVSVGEPTSGALSDTLGVILPNRWRVSLSNEIYTAVDGVVYESAGIPVDVALPAPEHATLASYIRLGMDTAIRVLQQN